ncbi:MAG TPA: 5'/3'-nucleotidase SurE [Acidimicrobiales bacterium]|nr:5'/3'-nucleotidase SurE [Acidimicrobiales bacterium]
MTTPARVLVTNDDGVESEGIAALAAVAHELGLEVLVAAPASNVSGVSASLAGVREEGRLLIEERTFVALPGVKVLAVEAAPAMIVRAGMNGAFGPAPDLVLSGINDGPNTGHSVLHSGTVGAALTAVTSHCSAVAFSIGIADKPEGPSGPLSGGDYRAAVDVARRVIPWALDARTRSIVTLNVNVPSGPPEIVRGIRAAPLASFGAVETSIVERAEGHVILRFEEYDATQEPETDAALLADGWTTVTALRSVSEDTAADLSGLVGSPAPVRPLP